MDSPSGFQVKVLASLSQGLHSIYSDRLLCDLKVTVGSQTFDCHRLVLAAVSGFFQSLVSRSWAENSAGEVKIEHEDVTAESFQMLLDILYKTEDVINKATATDVLRMASFLQVKFLEEYCSNFIETNITPDVCVGTWMFAEKYQLKELAEKACAMASDQFLQVIQSDEVLQLPKSMLLVVLGSQRKLNMDNLCRTILRWVEHDRKGRQKYFSELLPFVSFPQLSPTYISQLMTFFDHPFKEHLSKHIQEAISCNLEGQQPQLKRQILARQDHIAASPLIHTCAVFIGGATESKDEVKKLSAVRLDVGEKWSTYTLTAPPEPCGSQFASCVWRNELYVSRCTEQGICLSRYITSNNEWETLPHCEQGLRNYAMVAACGSIYILGGSSLRRKKASCTVQVYNVNNKSWSRLKTKLPLAVEDAAAAVVGHRIYVFGGKDADGNPVDGVQCVDSTSGCVYLAGRLPAPCGQVLALSDGGTIYVLCGGAQVLRMRERYSVVEQKERKAIEWQKTGITGTGEDNQTQSADLSLSASAIFTEVGTFTGDKVLSALLHDGEMITCGGASQTGDVTVDSRAMNLTTGKVTNKRHMLRTSMHGFKLHVLHVPKDFLDEGEAVGHFLLGDRVRVKAQSPLSPQRHQNDNFGRSMSDQHRYFPQPLILQQTRHGPSVSYYDIANIQGIASNGQVTVNFQNGYGSWTTQAKHLQFA